MQYIKRSVYFSRTTSEYDFGQKPSWKGTREKYSVFDPSHSLFTSLVPRSGLIERAVRISRPRHHLIPPHSTTPLLLLVYRFNYFGSLLKTVQLREVQKGLTGPPCDLRLDAHDLHSLVADVLALSLFDFTEPVLLHHKRWKLRNPQPFEQAGASRCLVGGEICTMLRGRNP